MKIEHSKQLLKFTMCKYHVSKYEEKKKRKKKVKWISIYQYSTKLLIYRY